MRIGTTNTTAKQAADEFAATAFETPRKVGAWRKSPREPLVPQFRLVGGRQWYSVLLADDRRGWEIVCDLAPA